MFLLLNLESSYVQRTSPLLDMWFANVFSLLVGCFFYSVVSFDMQKFLEIFLVVFKFDIVPFIIFCFCCLAGERFLFD